MEKYEALLLYPEWFTLTVNVRRLPIQGLPEPPNENPRQVTLPDRGESDDVYASASKRERAVMYGTIKIWELPQDFRTRYTFHYALRHALTMKDIIEVKLIEKVLLEDIERTGDELLISLHEREFGEDGTAYRVLSGDMISLL